jgi:hypothetical protein
VVSQDGEIDLQLLLLLFSFGFVAVLIHSPLALFEVVQRDCGIDEGVVGVVVEDRRIVE